MRKPFPSLWSFDCSQRTQFSQYNSGGGAQAVLQVQTRSGREHNMVTPTFWPQILTDCTGGSPQTYLTIGNTIGGLITQWPRSQTPQPRLCAHAYLPQVCAFCNARQHIEAVGRRGQTGDRPGAHDLLLELVLQGHKKPLSFMQNSGAGGSEESGRGSPGSW